MTYIAKNVIKSVGLELPSVKSSFLDLSLFWYYYTVLISISFSLSYIYSPALLMLASFFLYSLYIISDWIDNNNQTKGRDKKKRKKSFSIRWANGALYWCLLLLCSINRASAGAIRLDPFYCACVCSWCYCCWAPVEFIFHRSMTNRPMQPVDPDDQQLII